MKLDDINRSIIAMLQEDGRQPNASIARALGVSEATIGRRIKQLLDAEIFAIQAVPDPQKFGLPT